MQHNFKNRDARLRAPAVRIESNTPHNFAIWPSFLLGALLVLFSATAVQAGTLKGTVLDPSGRPVPQAHVTLLRSLAVVDQQQTDSQGVFKFATLANGKYQLAVDAPGLSSPQAEVEIHGADVQTLDLHLQLSAVQQQVVVSASLAGSLASEVGSSVSVVPGQEISDRAAQNVLDVLTGIPGVEASQAGRHGGATGVYVRGGESNYNLVMVDGMELNQFGGSFDFAPLPADGVQRVEVTRGPESALYGPNAVTSVINIVTLQGEGTPHFTLQAEGGSFTTRRFLADGSGLTHGLNWGFDVSRLDSGGLVANDQYRNQSAFLSLGYHRSQRRRLDFHFFGNANNAGAPGPYGSDPDGLFGGIDRISRDKQNMFGWEGSYSEQITSNFRQVTTGNVSTNDSYFRSPYGDSYSNNLRGVLNTRSEVAVSNKDFFVAGFEYNREQVEDTYIANNNGVPFVLPRTSLAFFAENRWSPTHRLYLTTGFRLDDLRTHSLPADSSAGRPLLDPSTIVKVNPRVSAAYMLRESNGGSMDGTRLHASFGTGIRAPDGFNLAFTNNPHLKPEKSISFDAGIEQRFFHDKAVLDFTYFNNHFKDQIVTLGGSLTNLSSFASDNLGNSRAQGAEISFQVHPIKSLQMSAEYTLDNTVVLALNGTSQVLAPLQVGQELFRRPRNSGAYNLTWRHGNLMLNTNAYIRGPVLDIEPNYGAYACSMGMPCLFTNKGYVRVDGGFSYRLPRGVEIYGRLDNIVDQKYEEVFGYPSLPFNFLAGVRFTFPGR
ncbi:MAG: TonB-dependent receptor [Acidobacteriota bacterium]|nr:TonB-dependent receptor [Acidobacteriota bacterium]